MPRYDRFRAALIRAGVTALLLAGVGQNVLASPITPSPITLSVSGMVVSSTVNGVQVGAGSYTVQMMLDGSALGSFTANGATGISLWSLLGGDSAGASDVVTSTPAGSNAKNAILRSYVLATSVTGAQSIISLGEIDPFFGGTAAIPPFIAFAGTDGQPALIFPLPLRTFVSVAPAPNAPQTAWRRSAGFHTPETASRFPVFGNAPCPSPE
jgi:hypothetical protein